MNEPEFTNEVILFIFFSFVLASTLNSSATLSHQPLYGPGDLEGHCGS